jgi:hypothetical protein
MPFLVGEQQRVSDVAGSTKTTAWAVVGIVHAWLVMQPI